MDIIFIFIVVVVIHAHTQILFFLYLMNSLAVICNKKIQIVNDKKMTEDGNSVKQNGENLLIIQQFIHHHKDFHLFLF